MPKTQEMWELPSWALAVIPGTLTDAPHLAGTLSQLGEDGWKVTDCRTKKPDEVFELLKTDGPHLLVGFPHYKEDAEKLATQTDKVLLAAFKTVPTLDADMLKPLDICGSLHTVPRLNHIASIADMRHHIARMLRAYDDDGKRRVKPSKAAA